MILDKPRVSHVFPVNLQMWRVNRSVTNVPQIPRTKKQIRRPVLPVVRVQNQNLAVPNVQNAMRVKPGWVLMVRVTCVPPVNTVPVIWMLPVAVRVRMVSVKVIRGKLRASNVVPANSTMFRVLFVVNYV
jgi:hypothetical protein